MDNTGRNSGDSEIKILQTNLGRDRAAMDLLSQSVLEQGVHLVIVSEPNKAMVKTGGWQVDPRGDVAIKILKPDLKVGRKGAGEGFVWAQVEGIYVMGCYFSPNREDREFDQFLNDIRDQCTHMGMDKLEVGGDFNAKGTRWGAQLTDARGQAMGEWAEELNMEVVNEGNTPTFVRGNSVSYIDVTMCSVFLLPSIKEWTVHEGENLSLHRNITFTVDLMTNRGIARAPREEQGWKTDGRSLAELTRITRRIVGDPAYRSGTVEECGVLLKRACNMALPVRGKAPQRREVYWWTEEIAECRSRCLRARRTLARVSRNGSPDTISRMRTEFRSKKKELKDNIRKAKNKCWNKLVNELEENIWGDAYQIAIKKFGYLKPNALDPTNKRRVAEELFPADRINRWPRIPVEGVPQIDGEEIERAAAALKEKRHPDQIRYPLRL